ncbi:MAG: 50S ribosomal protein L21 [Acidobacteria bacterium]|nr:50S ribosomal protein L21 [Acidobacteriota bacterium]MBV9146532.1 50S ribosomal protein L21 [Acidobacteriota bacterium]MBV9436127.1 50S ribosomal protein L21 [Acidobacteriota bacterium]
MYAVIRAGGRQFRVAPGDVIKVDQKPGENGNIEFTDVLAVSANEGELAKPQSGARVVGSVVEEGRADKILVFHFKRKKQYKKLQGHRQPFTAVRITEIAFDGQKFNAPEQPSPKPKKEKAHMASKQTEQKAEKKARSGAEGKASKSSKSRTDKGTARAAQKPAKKK